MLYSATRFPQQRAALSSEGPKGRVVSKGRSSFRIHYALMLLLVMWGFLEGAFLALQAIGRRLNTWQYQPIETRILTPEQRDLILKMLSGEGYVRLDAELGWTNAAGGGSKDGLYRINVQELRADREYSQDVPSGKVRLATYGDSFTFGAFVKVEETWQSQLESANPQIEILNYGVSGYGPDQAYLRYARSRGQPDTDVVVIGYMSENIARLVNRFRPFYIPLEKFVFSKPRFELDEDENLILLENPLTTPDDYRRLLSDPGEVLAELAEHDYWAEVRNHSSSVDVLPSTRVFKILLYHLRRRAHPDHFYESDGTYRVTSPAYRILVSVMEKFYRAVEERGQIPIVLIYPRIEEGNGVPSYEPLLTFLESRGMRYVDVLPGLIEEVGVSNLPELYFDDHLNARGNGIVAREMTRRLQEIGEDEPRVRAGFRPESLRHPSRPVRLTPGTALHQLTVQHQPAFRPKALCDEIRVDGGDEVGGLVPF